MNEFNAIIEKAGLTKESLKSAILYRIKADGVRLADFSEEQKQKIVVRYAAAVLA